MFWCELYFLYTTAVQQGTHSKWSRHFLIQSVIWRWRMKRKKQPLSFYVEEDSLYKVSPQSLHDIKLQIVLFQTSKGSNQITSQMYSCWFAFDVAHRDCVAKNLKRQKKKRAMTREFLMNLIQGRDSYFSSSFVPKQLCPHMFSCDIQMLQWNTHVLNKLWT